MNEENQVSYYSIIPATVRYDKKLKSSEKLIYGEITSLTNALGYCYASNKYFADLYEVNPHTVSQWISHLEKQGYIQIELLKDEKKEIKERRIYIIDIPYVRKNTYPYVSKSTYPMYKKVQENNKEYNIDDLFYIIINSSEEISKEFYEILKQFELIYPKEILDIMQKENIEMLKGIIYTLWDLFNSKMSYLFSAIDRESLVNLYIVSKEHEPNDLLNYYKRSIINKYTNNST